MAGAQGKNYLIKISDTASSPQTYSTLECQGEAALNTGKALEISRTKNCAHPYFTEAGYTLNTQVEIEAPIGTQQGKILEAADNETTLYVQFISSESGVPKWEGEAYVAYDPFTTPIEGIVTIDVAFAFVNDPTRGVST